MLTMPHLDMDLLAQHLQSKMRAEGLSLRKAAQEIGCSPATLSRLLLGRDSPNHPEGINLVRAASWLGKSLADFEVGNRQPESTIADVEAHLRALRDLPKDAVEGLIAMIRAVYDERRIEKNQK